MHTSKNKTVPALLSTLLLLCTLLFASCSVNVSAPTTSNGDTTNNTPLSTTPNAQPAGTGNLKVFVEPDMGSGVITDAIHQAQKSIWLEMYLLTDRSIISALEEAAHRNLDVRVMLEAHPYGSGGLSPTQTLDRLQAAGIQTKSTSPDFTLTHEKGMVIDGSTAFIMTSNFTLSALGGSKTTKNREYGIIDSNPQDVQTVSEIFTADWNRTPLQQIDNPHLVVSPINSRTDFKTLIGSAKKTLLVEAEEMQDAEIEQALSNAAHRGVQVQVILPSPSSSSSDSSGSNDSNSQGISTIQQAGIQVKESTQLYMHAKIFVVDGSLAFVGSENISTASLNQNRELGILISDPNILSTLQQTFQQDWSNSSNA
jgi:cardiolipin synthase A/B